jgi:hypothetical protein
MMISLSGRAFNSSCEAEFAAGFAQQNDSIAEFMGLSTQHELYALANKVNEISVSPAATACPGHRNDNAFA